MRFRLVLVLLAASSVAAASSRRKRLLVFPPNSALTLSACLAKGGIILQPPAFIFTFDFDILFQLPTNTSVWTGLGPYKVLRKEKRDLYLGMEELLERQGIGGKACILRALCEAKQILGQGGGLMEDIFHTLFSLEPKESDLLDEVDYDLQDHDHAHSLGGSRFACHQLYSSCPISLLHYALW